MTINTAPPPIPGDVIDPPPKTAPDKVHEIDQKDGVASTGVGVGYRAYMRFSHAKAPLLAAGTAYYLFFALFSIIPLGYGIVALVNADGASAYLTEALAEAFPGLLGDEAIDPGRLRAVGSSTSIIGALGLLYGGTGAVGAASQSLHLIYGAPKDPRNIVVAKARAIGWLVVIGPLILLTYVVSSVAFNLSDSVLSALGIEWRGPGIAITAASAVGAVLISFLIVFLLLGHLGGIRPELRARIIGAAVGAVVIELLKALMAVLVGFTVDKPEYGAFAAPIGVLLVLYLQSMALYGAASLTAGIADRDVPLEVLAATDAEEAQAAVEEAAQEPDQQSGKS